MRRMITRVLLIVAASLAFATADARAATERYNVDPDHSIVGFSVVHMVVSKTTGRFKDYTGFIEMDPEAKTVKSIEAVIHTPSLDTNHGKRDTHLRSPDFFNVKQFPQITFKSTAVKAAKDGYEVTGDLTLHGETKPVTFTLVGGQTAEFPPKVKRTGFSTDLVVKRSEFGMKGFAPALGDDVHVAISFEATKK